MELILLLIFLIRLFKELGEVGVGENLQIHAVDDCLDGILTAELFVEGFLSRYHNFKFIKIFISN